MTTVFLVLGVWFLIVLAIVYVWYRLCGFNRQEPKPPRHQMGGRA